MTNIYNLIPLNNHIYMIDKIPDAQYIGPYIITWASGFKEIYNSYNSIANSRRNLSLAIIASTDKSLGLPLLPSIEEDIEKIIRKSLTKAEQEFLGQSSIDDLVHLYKAASAKKYTEEDVRKAIIFGFEQCLNNETISPDGSGETGIFEKDIKPFIESLNPLPKQVEIEMEMEFITTEDDQNDPIGHFWIPKVDANNIVQVVKWIYG